MKIHFIGIGGIGVSALAKYYLVRGHKVSGSDLVSSEITDSLSKLGAKISISKHKAENLAKDADLVIYSPAVQPNNPELLKAKSYKLKIHSYPEALGDLTKKYFTIAVSGTHGKSTTTAMIALILAKAGFDPTVIIGTKLKEFGNPALSEAEGSNCRVGKHIRQAQGKIQYLVIEADEWQASFLNYWPKIIVLTNIEKEHLDYYKNLGHILRTYKKYISHLAKDGILIANKDDKNISKLKFKKKEYSLKQSEAKKLKKLLKIPGEHNVSNALASLAVARILKILDKITYKALSEYKGAWRRFETHNAKINKKPITIISDYGHHPTEIRETLKAAKEKFPKQKIWLVFQPHQYQRTYYLFDDFVNVFKQTPIDTLIITDIYDVAGRETKEIKHKINSEKLVEAINPAPFTTSKRCRVENSKTIYLPNKKIKEYLKKNLKGREVVIIMGAGDIYDLTRELIIHR